MSVNAPPGRGLTLVFSDIEGSTPLWDADPESMSRAIDLHDTILRTALIRHGGYEMRTEGDAFKVAFVDASHAIRWAIDVQRELLDADWDDRLLALELAGEQRAGDKVVYRGLRVRIGLHTGDAEAKLHPTTGRMDYYGPMVNATARIAATGAGGQIVASAETLASSGKVAGVFRHELGIHMLKGVSRSFELFELIGERLPQRSHPPLKTQRALGVAGAARREERKHVSAVWIGYPTNVEAGREALVDAWVDEVVGQVRRLGAHVHSRSDACLSVIFGVPRVHQDDAERAARFAVSIMQSVSEVASLVAPDSDAFGAVVRTGDVHVVTQSNGAVTVTGPCVDDAPVLSGRGAAIAADRSTREALEALAPGDWARLEDGLWSLPDLPHRATVVQPAVVGREVEIAAVSRATRKLQDGLGHVVCICGQAGIGKTRLKEHLRAVAGDTVRWFESQGAASVQTSYGPIVDILRRTWGLIDSESPLMARAKLRAALSVISDESARNQVQRVVGQLLQIPSDVDDGVLDPRALSANVALGLRTLLGNEGAPTVIALDDAHQLDDGTLQALTALCDLTDHLPLMLVVAWRPGISDGIEQFVAHAHRNFRHRLTELNLEPLDANTATELATSLLGPAIPAEVSRELAERAGGNPLFLIESVRSLRQQGYVENGTWAHQRGVLRIPLPSSVRGVVAERIDSLEPHVRQTLQRASVIGRRFERTEVEALSPDADLDDALAQLVRSELISERRRIPTREYAFTSDLVRETAYETLTSNRLPILHQRAGTSLEQSGAARTQEGIERLAEHFSIAGDRARALEYAMKAAEWAEQLSSPALAVRHYWRALGLLGRSTDRERRQHLEITQRLLSLPGWAAGGSYEQGLDHLETALQVAHEIEELPAVVRLTSIKGLQRQSAQLLREALQIAEQCADPRSVATAATRYGDYLGSKALYSEAFPYIYRAIELYEKADDPYGRALAMAVSGRCYSARAGHLTASLELAAAARAIAEKTEDPNLLAWRAMEAEPLMYQGAWNRVVEVANESLPIAWEVGARSPVFFASAWLGVALVQLARYDEARAVLDRAEREAAIHPGAAFPLTYIRIARAQLDLVDGEFENAEKRAQAAVEAATQRGYRMELGAANRVLAEVLMATNRPIEASACLEAALQELRQTEARPELAITLMTKARLLGDSDPAASEAAAQEGESLLREMGATGWLPG